MGTNCLGPWLFNSFLEPILKRTAAFAPVDSVRIVWLSSMVAVSVPQGGVQWDEKTGQPKVLKNQMESYMESKVGNMFISSHLASRLSQDGIINLVGHLVVCWDPQTKHRSGYKPRNRSKRHSEERLAHARLYDGMKRYSQPSILMLIGHPRTFSSSQPSMAHTRSSSLASPPQSP